MNALERLRAVLCAPDGEVVIDGTDADRSIVAEALEELDAALSQTAGVPDGWKLVPVEPTEAMCEAAMSSLGWSRSQAAATAAPITPASPMMEGAMKVWSGMLAAAPAASGGESHPDAIQDGSLSKSTAKRVDALRTTQPPHQDRGEVAAFIKKWEWLILSRCRDEFAADLAALTEAKQQGPGEAVLDLPARVAGRDFAAGQSTRQVIGRAQAHYEVHHEGCLRHPHTGELRDYRDVESDPDGTLCVGPGPLPSADTRQWGNSVLAPMKTVFVIHRPNGTPFQRDDAMGILATESEAQAIRFAHAREDEGAQYVRYVATAPQVEAKRQTGEGESPSLKQIVPAEKRNYLDDNGNPHSIEDEAYSLGWNACRSATLKAIAKSEAYLQPPSAASVSERARELLAAEYEAEGWRTEAGACRRGSLDHADRFALSAIGKIIEQGDEDDHVITELGRLLASIAVILKGPEPAGTAWSYHDLPGMVNRLKAERDSAPSLEQALTQQRGAEWSDDLRAVLDAASEASQVPLMWLANQDFSPEQTKAWLCEAVDATVEEGAFSGSLHQVAEEGTGHVVAFTGCGPKSAANAKFLIWCVHFILKHRDALATTPQPSADAVRDIYDAAAKGFHTSETNGAERKYLHVIRFQSIEDLHGYEDAWTAAMVKARDAK